MQTREEVKKIAQSLKKQGWGKKEVEHYLKLYQEETGDKINIKPEANWKSIELLTIGTVENLCEFARPKVAEES